MHGNRPQLPTNFVGGIEWLIDARQCNADRLVDLECVRAVCETVLSDLKLNVVGEPLFHRFGGPGGVTAMYLLAESHLTCHTYPEVGFATFNLYCCRNRESWSWESELRQRFDAEHVVIRTIQRHVTAERLMSCRDRGRLTSTGNERI